MKNATTLNEKKIKKLYLQGCKEFSIKPKKNNLNNFVQFLEADAKYWMRANLKFFFEQMNH
ncbi:MAG: hypothetical protein Q8Q23_00225 [bacterium]|nr:hypothetical protein [bacterium]